MLSIDVASMIWVVINLLILYVIFRKLLYDRVMDVLQKRKETLDEQFKDAKKKKKAAKRLKKEYQEVMNGAHAESMKMIEDAKIRGDNLYQRKVEEAEEAVSALMQKANEDIEAERTQAKREAQAEITSLAMAAAAKIIGETANSETDQDMYDQFLAKAGEKNDANGN